MRRHTGHLKSLSRLRIAAFAAANTPPAIDVDEDIARGRNRLSMHDAYYYNNRGGEGIRRRRLVGLRRRGR